MKPVGNIYAGTSGLVIPVPKRDFPLQHQDKSRLGFYATLFNSVEINSSFYKVPQTGTVQKWADEVPMLFRFTYKLWRDITHNKQLIFNPADVERFMQVIHFTGIKKGCLLIQLPPGTGITLIDQLDNLLSTVRLTDPSNSWNIAVEFRNRSWYHEESYSLLKKYNAGMVLHDLPPSTAPMLDELAPFVYLRFHGPGGGYRGSYPDDFLYEYAQYIQSWQEGGKDVYIYFNNTMGDALRNLMTLNKMLKA